MLVTDISVGNAEEWRGCARNAASLRKGNSSGR